MEKSLKEPLEYFFKEIFKKNLDERSILAIFLAIDGTILYGIHGHLFLEKNTRHVQEKLSCGYFREKKSMELNSSKS